MSTPSEQRPLIIHYHSLKNIPVPIQALCEAGLNPTQWTLLYLMAHPELRNELLAMIHCPNKPLLWTNEDMQDLLDRFYLIREPHPDAPSKTDLMNFRVSPRFTDLLSTLKEAWLPAGHYKLARPIAERQALRGGISTASADKLELCAPTTTIAPALEELEAFDALFRTYPRHIPVNGILMSCWNGDYCIMAASYESYLASKGALEHKRILDIVRWAKEQNLLTMRLHKFIDSHGWLGLQELWDQASAGSGRK